MPHVVIHLKINECFIHSTMYSSVWPNGEKRKIETNELTRDSSQRLCPSAPTARRSFSFVASLLLLLLPVRPTPSIPPLVPRGGSTPLVAARPWSPYNPLDAAHGQSLQLQRKIGHGITAKVAISPDLRDLGWDELIGQLVER